MNTFTVISCEHWWHLPEANLKFTKNIPNEAPDMNRASPVSPTESNKAFHMLRALSSDRALVVVEYMDPGEEIISPSSKEASTRTMSPLRWRRKSTPIQIATNVQIFHASGNGRYRQAARGSARGRRSPRGFPVGAARWFKTAPASSSTRPLKLARCLMAA